VQNADAALKQWAACGAGSEDYGTAAMNSNRRATRCHDVETPVCAWFRFFDGSDEQMGLLPVTPDVAELHSDPTERAENRQTLATIPRPPSKTGVFFPVTVRAADPSC